MGKNLEPLTGLRGVAAYSVMAGHLLDVPGNGLQGLAGSLAYFGMSLFFVLSGFVIYYNYADRFWRDGLPSAAWQFFVARFARLYPLYAVIVIYSMNRIPDPRLENSWIALAYGTLTQSWFNVQMTVFAPAWSISTEWFFYFAFVPLVFVVRPIERPVLALGLYCGVALLAVVLVFGLFTEPLFSFVDRVLVFDPKVSAAANGWTVYFAPPLRLLEFIAGMFAARAYLAQTIRPRARLPSLFMWAAVVWCVVVILAAAFFDVSLVFAYTQCNFLFAPALSAFMLCVCLSRDNFSRCLSTRPLQFLGEISYSVYIWQFAVITALTAKLQSFDWTASETINLLLRAALIAGATTLAAYASYLGIELPARRWLRMALGGSQAKRRSPALGE